MTISPTTDRTTGRHERHATAGHIRNRLVSLMAVPALMLASGAFIRAEVTAAWAEPAENVPDLPVELVQVPVPELGLYGRAAFRTDPGLSGVSDNAGLDRVAGTYWVREPAGFLRGDPVARGRLLFVSSPTYDTVFVMDLTTGDVVDELTTSSLRSRATFRSNRWGMSRQNEMVGGFRVRVLATLVPWNPSSRASIKYPASRGPF